MSDCRCNSNKSYTFPFENRKNIAAIALSPDANVLVTVDEGAISYFDFKDVLHHLRWQTVALFSSTFGEAWFFTTLTSINRSKTSSSLRMESAYNQAHA
jgi:hypothetical protein